MTVTHIGDHTDDPKHHKLKDMFEHIAQDKEFFIEKFDSGLLMLQGKNENGDMVFMNLQSNLNDPEAMYLMENVKQMLLDRS